MQVEELEQARQLYDESAYQGALQIYMEALARKPQDLLSKRHDAVDRRPPTERVVEVRGAILHNAGSCLHNLRRNEEAQVPLPPAPLRAAHPR